MDSFNPLDVLREDMESEEVHHKVNAIHRMKIVASLLPADKIKSQLLPYIEQLMKKEEDEVLFALADELGNIAQLMPNQPLIVLPQLEILAGYDETVVRDQAIKGIIKICSMVSDADINTQIIPMLFKLAANEANFTCRVSAVNLMCPLYPRAGNQKEKIRQKFTELCNEETPMVRRAVAIKIGEIAEFMEKAHVINDLIPIQKQLCQDEQDQVRLLCMESLKNMAKILNTNDNKTNTLPLIIQAAEDKSWRVRLALSKIFAELSEAVGKEIADSSLIQIFSNLLKDVESDVRVVAVNSLAKFIRFVSPEKLQLIIPQLQILCRDSSSQVKSMVTEVIAVIVTLLPKEYSQNKLGSYLLEMLNDENSDVRKGAAKAAGKFSEVVGTEALNLFIPALKQGMEDPKWRVRKEILQTIMHLALNIKNPDVYMKYLEPVYLLFMKDRSMEVRDIGLERLPEIMQVYKNDQILASLLAKITENTQKDKGHAFRGTAILALGQISQVIPQDIIVDKLLPLVLKNVKDGVPNIRAICIRVLKVMSKRVDNQGGANQIKQAIQEMQNDTDRDVAFCASEALQY